jgi:hypothetical protein
MFSLLNVFSKSTFHCFAGMYVKMCEYIEFVPYRMCSMNKSFGGSQPAQYPVLPQLI